MLWSGLVLFRGLPFAQAFEIEGRISTATPRLTATEVEVKRDSNHCGARQTSQTLLVSGEGYLENAVVSLEGDLSGSTGPGAERPVLNQKDCHFEPHILLVPQDQTFLVGNQDPMAHDVRAFDGAKMMFRFEMDALDEPVEKTVGGPGRFVIRCGLHPWMHAYVISTKHPYYAITDEQGRFKLGHVPEGQYSLRIWHEQLGELEMPIEVTQSVDDFSYTFAATPNAT